MCSRKPHELLGSDAVDLLFDAVSAVADRSFYAVVQRSDEDRFAALVDEAGAWMGAVVQFHEIDCSGAVSCALPEELAHALFDAFTGRDPRDPAPPPEHVDDLVGEFTNQICGAWLTRLASRKSFSLAPPVVTRGAARPSPAADGVRMLLAVNDLPLVVEVRAAATAPRPTAGVA